jgi:hypothetical protein
MLCFVRTELSLNTILSNRRQRTHTKSNKDSDPRKVFLHQSIENRRKSFLMGTCRISCCNRVGTQADVLTRHSALCRKCRSSDSARDGKQKRMSPTRSTNRNNTTTFTVLQIAMLANENANCHDVLPCPGSALERTARTIALNYI